MMFSRSHCNATMMSSAESTPIPSSSAAPAAAPATKVRQHIDTITIHDTTTARVISTARPGLFLGLLAVRFSALVTDPAGALGSALPVVAVMQIVYAVVCLPAAGSKAIRKARPGEKRKSSGGGPDRISTAVISLVLTAMATPVTFALMVLFGAPLLDDVAKTMLCSAHLALLGLFPIFYARGVDGDALLSVTGATAPLDETFGGLLGAVTGAWLGAVPIPLDWDRQWQRWPVTIVVGLYGGSLLCSWLAGTWLLGRKLGGKRERKQE
ncbi:hypothetical protein CP532_0369 [Ophiocordyceps camponoti-leonardi (nom. inval.)]|nr:hypothetical protein CP532_0369 [Ophiocordyceps camponoti-leonardi (nom. inval.)]